MADDRYQVIAECAYVKTSDASGVSWRLLEKGALFYGPTPNLQHLLDNGYAVRVGGDATGGVDASGIPVGAYDAPVPVGPTSTPVERTEQQRKADAEAEASDKAAADLAEKRAEARAKLPADGSAPDGRASKDVLVEYLAGKNYDYAELVKADKSDLVDLAKQA